MNNIVMKLLVAMLFTASIGTFGMNNHEKFQKQKRDGTKKKINFRLEKMIDQTLTSGDRATFKCKIDLYEKFPVNNFTFVWYKNNILINSEFIKMEYDRLTIKQKNWGSQMRINDVYSSDSGSYKCEASYGSTRTHVSSKLNVGFNLLPDDAKKTEVDEERLQGKCEIYKGNACDKYFGGKYVYIDAFSDQTKLEESVNQLPGVLSQAKVSSRCSDEFIRTSCYFLFSLCDPSVHPPLQLPLCREDCEILKYDICRKELQAAKNNYLLNEAFQTDCTALPATFSPRTDKCTKIHANRAVIGRHKCYNGTGEGYRGTLSITSSGESCSDWPNDMLQKYPSLAGGHNFCRNPNEVSKSPWCYVDNKIEVCQVPKCDGENNDLLKILIPAVSLPLLIACLVFIFCNVCRYKDKQQPTKGVIVKHTNSMTTKKVSVPELMPNNIHVINEIGEGKLGKIFKAQILGNYNFGSNDPVAVKTLRIGLENEFMDEFQKEIEIFSDLQHINIASLKGIIIQPSLRCMIFEFTAITDLHEYLTMHNPNGDFSSNISQSSSSFDTNYFIRMISEISAGMEYLSSKNFVHRDLATRNILVCSNMLIKISNLGFIQDSSLSNYYRSPQGGQMLPIRWMSPESLHSWQFSNKSAVWSFGVVLWEMYSFGMQPYCGYSNHEVLAMIGRRRLLSCPDQCPSKIYSLMMECWYENSVNRPSFKDIGLKLAGWESCSNTRVTSQLAQGIHRQLDQLKQGDAVIRQIQPNSQNITNQNVMLPLLRQNVVSGNDSSVESSSNAFVSLKNYPSYHVNNRCVPVNGGKHQTNNLNYPNNNQGYQTSINQPDYNSYHQRTNNDNVVDYQSSRQSSSVYSKSTEGSVNSHIKEPNVAKQVYSVNPPFPTDFSKQEDLHTKNKDMQVTACSQKVLSPTNSHRKQMKLEKQEFEGEKKTTSCDSGLPVEGEFGSDGADSAKPLINKNTG